jgi:ferredoxin
VPPEKNDPRPPEKDAMLLPGLFAGGFNIQNRSMKIPEVELSQCDLCGICVEVAPSVFRINDSGFVMVIDLPAYPEDDVDEAIKHCPADCIYWEDI